MHLRTLFVICFITINITNAHAYEFYTRTIGGPLHGQAKFFTQTGRLLNDGWREYSVDVVGRSGIQLDAMTYMVNCTLSKVVLSRQDPAFVASHLSLAVNPVGSILNQVQVNNILGPACKA